MHQRHEINSIIFKQLSQSKIVKAFGGYKIWSCKAISLKKYMHFFRPLPPLAIPSQPSEHTPAELAGEGCTLEMMLNGFNGQPRSLWSGAVILRQVQCICSQPTCGSKVVVQNWFKTVQNYCLRSILFSSGGSLAEDFSWQLLHLHIGIVYCFILR